LFSKVSKFLAYIFLVYLFLGFFVLPLVLKPQVIKIIESQTNTKVAIESLSFNPILFAMELKNVDLKSLDNKPLISFGSLHVNVDPTSLFFGALELKELLLQSPRINLVYNKNRTINLLKIVKKSQPKEKPATKSSTLPRLIIDTVKLADGSLFYKDFTRKTPFEFSLHNIGFVLKDIDTKDINKSSAGVRIYSKLGDGGFVDFKSKITSLKPLKLAGTLDFEASKLYTEWKYMQDVLNLEVADGKVSFHAGYMFNMDDLNATTIKGLNISLEKLRIKPKDRDKDILNLDSLYVKDAKIQPFSRNVAIEKIGLYGLMAKVKRHKDGTINWLEYVKTNTTNQEQNSTIHKPTETHATPWRVKLDTLSLEKIAVDFDDEAITPNVKSSINELDIYAKNLTLAGVKPFEYQIQMRLNGSGDCNVSGDLAHKKLLLNAYATCSDLDVVHYKPYIDMAAQANLKVYDIALKSLLVDFKAQTKVYDENNTLVVDVRDANTTLKAFKLLKKSTNKELIRFKDLKLGKIDLNTQAKKVSVGSVSLDNLVCKLSRSHNEKLNIENIIVPKKSKKKKTKHKTKKASAYSVKIATAKLNNATIYFNDKGISKLQKHRIDRVYVTLNNLDNAKYSWLRYKVSMRLNKKGNFNASGKLRHTPLTQVGSARLKNLSLKDITPYLQERTYLSVDDGRVGFRIKEHYQPSKKKPDFRATGTFTLNSLFVSDTHDANASLFTLNELTVKPFTLELLPNRLYADEVNVNGFYVAAKIDANKTMNFSKIMKPNVQENNATKPDTKSSQEPFPVKVVKVNVKNGSAEFKDFSLPIKFQTDIHNLHGVIYALSSTPGDTTYANIDGEVDKYGSTKLRGSVDSFNPKEYTDLDFNFKNLDLHAMSGYSASFAGYEIDSGKLYLDLGYNILHSKLDATNNIMIKKIKLGKELEGDDVKHLPLGFVIGLLEDNDGIIDIDMPIEGDVDAPDFKYGTLVWKTLGNLIAKAVTSPFKFLGSMMGMNTADLEYIAFEFGKSNITPPQREKLDKLVKMMQKRPKITLELNGLYYEKKDTAALKLQKLIEMVAKESGEQNIQKNKTALNIEILEKVYKQMRNDNRLEAIKKSLSKQYKDEEFTRAYQNKLISICTEIEPLTKEELLHLAQQREENIRNYLVKERLLSKDRVQSAVVEKAPLSEDKSAKLKLNIEVQSKDK